MSNTEKTTQELIAELEKQIKLLNADNFKIIFNLIKLMAAGEPYLDALPEEVREIVIKIEQERDSNG